MSNTGLMPPDAAGKRVRSVLANGHRFGFEAVSTTSPLGWSAATCRWTRTGSAFDIDQFEVIR